MIPERRSGQGVVLGIDFGTVRVGLAVSDALGMLARPLETIHVGEDRDPVERIAEIVGERMIATAAIGLPLRMDGSEGGAAERVRAFIGRLRERCPRLELVEVDERLTTREAEELLSGPGKRRRDRRELRGIIDQAAAVLILQDFLDQHQAAALPADPWDDGLDDQGEQDDDEHAGGQR